MMVILPLASLHIKVLYDQSLGQGKGMNNKK